MIRMLAKVWNAWPLLALLAQGIAYAQEHSRCQQIPFVSPKEDQPTVTADRVEGQLVAAVPVFQARSRLHAGGVSAPARGSTHLGGACGADRLA